MIRSIRKGLLGVVLFFLIGSNLNGFSQLNNDLSISFQDNNALANEKGQWIVDLAMQNGVIATGGAVKVRFIKGFGDLQNALSFRPRYCTVTCSNPNVNVGITSILDASDDFHSCWDSDVHSSLVTIKVISGNLNLGDVISLKVGGNNSDNQAIASKRSFQENLRTIVDINGDGQFVECSSQPLFKVLPKAPAEIKSHIRSHAKPNESVRVRNAVVDQFDNLVTDFEGYAIFNSSDNSINNAQISFTSGDGGTVAHMVSFSTEGTKTLTFDLYDSNDNLIASQTTNPVCVDQNNTNIYWGELHNHSTLSRDGIGNLSYDYAEHVAGLDFFSATEHSSQVSDIHGINVEEWQMLKDCVESKHKTGDFVTFLGFETSYKSPSGHYNMIFNHQDASALTSIDRMPKSEYPGILSVWQELDNLSSDIDALTIPHHCGKNFFSPTPPVETTTFGGSYKNSKYKRLLEVYSMHGSSEYYDPSHDLSYENMFSNSNSVNGPHYAQDAWAIGEKLGLIACSDNHLGLVSQNNEGVFAVKADQLDRNSVFEALKNRQTYATTGEKMIIDFKIDNQEMGSVIEYTGSDIPLEITYDVTGTDDLASIEILKWDFINGTYDSNGRPNYETVFSSDLSSLSSETTEGIIQDTFDTDSSLYYMRVKQVGKVNGHEVWAWTSPIWLVGADLVTGIKDQITSVQHFKLFPSIVVDGVVTAELYLTRADEFQVNIVDISGRILKQRSVDGKTNLVRTMFDIDDLAVGQYFIQVKSRHSDDKNAKLSKPFIVQ